MPFWGGEACFELRNCLEQVYRGQTSREGHVMEVQLRSDLEELPTVPVQVRVPTVWLLGNSAAAARSLMSGLSQEVTPVKPSTAAPVAPAEVHVDGVKWCNMLAAPVTTPALALTALTYALPDNPAQGDRQRTGPIRLANQAIQVSHLRP